MSGNKEICLYGLIFFFFHSNPELPRWKSTNPVSQTFDKCPLSIQLTVMALKFMLPIRSCLLSQVLDRTWTCAVSENDNRKSACCLKVIPAKPSASEWVHLHRGIPPFINLCEFKHISQEVFNWSSLQKWVQGILNLILMHRTKMSP